MRRLILTFLLPLLIFPAFLSAQTWVDSLDQYSREDFLPPKKYSWVWQKAPLLRTYVEQYELRPDGEKEKYLNYVKTAMANSSPRPNIKWPNGIASGHGVAFLWRVTGEEEYQKRAEKIYQQYLSIKRTDKGAVSHVPFTPELWDDTIYMIGVFLLEMYRATGDDEYVEQLIEQIRLHREKLLIPEWGLWVHGWDANDKTRMTICGCRKWPDKESRRSSEIWGRGNGWIFVILSDAIKTLPEEHVLQDEFRAYLKEMVQHLPDLQDQETGHWKQLPVKPDLEGNFIESSSTAMFAYGILTALQYNIVDGEKYEQSVSLAYQGLREHSLRHVEGPWLTTKNVCKGTCIGDEQYYLDRKVTDGKYYAVGTFITFGLHYELANGIRK